MRRDFVSSFHLSGEGVWSFLQDCAVSHPGRLSSVKPYNNGKMYERVLLK
jgi:hypothetical protein